MSNNINLLKKDFLLLQDYGVRYLFMILIISVLLSLNTGPIGLYYIMPMMASRYLLSATMNFEDRYNGYLSMSLLPIKRSEIVLSKYTLMVLMFLFGIVLAEITRRIGIAAGFYNNGNYPYLIVTEVSLLVNIISDCVRLPAVFKVGEVKARIYNMATMIVMIVLISVLLTTEVREFLFANMGILRNPLLLTLLIGGLSFLVLYISYSASVKIINARDL